MDPNKFEFESIKAKNWLLKNKGKDGWRDSFLKQWGNCYWLNKSGIDGFANTELKPAQKEWKQVIKEDAKYFLKKGHPPKQVWQLLKQRWCRYNDVGKRQWEQYVYNAKQELSASSTNVYDHAMEMSSSEELMSDEFTLDLSGIDLSTFKDVCGVCNTQKDEIFWEVGCYFMSCYNKYHACCMIPDPFNYNKMYCPTHWETQFVQNKQATF